MSSEEELNEKIRWWIGSHRHCSGLSGFPNITVQQEDVDEEELKKFRESMKELSEFMKTQPSRTFFIKGDLDD